MMGSFRKSALLLLVALTQGVAVAGDIHTVELKYRQAEQLIPVLRPLLAPGEAISGSGGTLAVRGSPQTLAQLRDLIASLDRVPRNLQITVRQVPARRSSSGGSHWRGNAERLRPDIRRLQTHERSLHAYRVTVTEGQPVSIFTRLRGADVEFDVLVAAYPILVRSTAYDSPPESGFSAIAHVVDDDVLLDIYTLKETTSGWNVAHSVESSEVRTRARIKPGEWLDLGGVDTSYAITAAPSTGKTVRTGNRGTTVAVKVEVLDD